VSKVDKVDKVEIVEDRFTAKCKERQVERTPSILMIITTSI